MTVIDEPSIETRKHFADRFTAMGSAAQALALARLAGRLSLMARDTYAVGGGVADSERLRTFNEAQNKILAQLERLLSSDPERYPEDIFANILCDQFEMLGADPMAFITALEPDVPPAARANSRDRNH